jgi:hypothetical protein
MACQAIFGQACAQYTRITGQSIPKGFIARTTRRQAHRQGAVTDRRPPLRATRPLIGHIYHAPTTVGRRCQRQAGLARRA